jgi:hypothetical protein
VSKTTDIQALDEIQPEHHRLGLIFEETLAHLAGGDGGSDCLELREALDAHFAREEALYYPTLWNLHPEFEPGLRGLIVAHSGFLEDLDRVIGLVDRGESARAQQEFEDLKGRFALHEQKEEALLRSMG